MLAISRDRASRLSLIKRKGGAVSKANAGLSSPLKHLLKRRREGAKNPAPTFFLHIKLAACRQLVGADPSAALFPDAVIPMEETTVKLLITINSSALVCVAGYYR